MTTFSITSFNARWGMTTADVPFDVVAAVARFDTDLVSLQEVWHPADGGPELLAAFGDLGYEVVHVPQSDSFVVPQPEITASPAEATGTWGVALLTRRPVLRTRVVELGRLVERWDVADRRAILVEVEVDGQPTSITALHLSFALPNAAAQLRRLAGYLPRDRPSVVAGDCNLWGPVAERLLTRHRRTVTGRTWPATRPHSQLDHVLVSPEVALVAGEVLAPAGSDHRPIRAVLRLVDGPRATG